MNFRTSSLRGTLLALAVVVAVGTPTVSGAGDKDVVVTNDATQPVPVTVQGTPSVTGSVTVSNQPTVHLDSNEVVVTNPAPIAVAVANDDPLLVRDRADINFLPFHRDLTGGCAVVDDFGSYVVIDFVTWSAIRPADEWTNVLPYVETAVVGTRVRHALAYNTHFIEADEQLGLPAVELLSASQATQLFAVPGSEVCIDGPGEVLYASISGHVLS